MSQAGPVNARVLAIDPFARGVGFAVFEGQDELIDWGIREAKLDKDKNQESLKLVAALINYYQPDVMVLEDPHHTSCRRRGRIPNLLADIRKLASKQRIRCRCLPQIAIDKACNPTGMFTRYQIANEIADRIPELEPHLPKRHKPWIGEDERMNIFDAAALALTFFARDKQNAKQE